MLPLYVLTVDPGVSGTILADLNPVLVTSTSTDSNGNALSKDLGVFPVGSYWLVADYDQDGIFHRDLDGFYPFLVGLPGGGGGGPNRPEGSGSLDAWLAMPPDDEPTAGSAPYVLFHSTAGDAVRAAPPARGPTGLGSPEGDSGDRDLIIDSFTPDSPMGEEALAWLAGAWPAI